MAFENMDKNQESIFSKKVKAGKRRTYFFDVKATRGNDYFLTITESCVRRENQGFERHKLFLFKEDFNKFSKALQETVGYVKTELMPNYDFEVFDYDESNELASQNGNSYQAEAFSTVAFTGQISGFAVSTNSSENINTLHAEESKETIAKFYNAQAEIDTSEAEKW